MHPSDRPITVLFVSGPFSNGLPTAGAERQTYYIAKELAKNHRYEVFIIAFKSDKRLFRHHHNLKIFCYPKFAYVGLFNILRQFRPMICYTRNLENLLALVTICKVFQTKVVFHTASKNHCRLLRLKEISKEPYFKRVPRTYMKLLLRKIKHDPNVHAMRLVDKILVQTIDQYNMLFLNFGLSAQKVPNGQYLCESFESVKKKKIIWVGKDFKNPTAFLQLSKMFKNQNLEFVMIGVNENQGAREWRKAWNKFKFLKDNSNLKLLGKLSRKKVLEEMKESLIFVNTNYMEGFPNTFIEAWMFGTPVVSLYVDPDDVMKSNNLGLHSGSFDRMVDQINYLVENPKICKDIGIRAREYVEKHHDITKLIVHYEGIFRSLATS